MASPTAKRISRGKRMGSARRGSCGLEDCAARRVRNTSSSQVESWQRSAKGAPHGTKP